MKKHDTVVELCGKVPVGSGSIDGLHAKITLPASPLEYPKMRLFPSSYEEMRVLMGAFKRSFEASAPLHMDGTGEERIVCEAFSILDGRAHSVSHDIQNYRIVCEPEGVWHSRDPAPATPATKSHIVFRLTPNRHLGKAAIVSQSFDGSCTVETVHQITFEILPRISLSFDRHYRWVKDKKKNSSVKIGFQVAVTEIEGDYHEPADVQGTVLPALDDLLLLTSFASHQRCLCVGWQVSDETGRSSRYDRGNTARPDQDNSLTSDDGLIDPAYMEEYFAIAWTSFKDSPYKQAIRSAIYALRPMHRLTEANRYLSLFSALEELALVYKRQGGKDVILSEIHWSRLNCALIAEIKKEVTDKPTRKLMYEKLREINRPAIRGILKDFIDSLEVDLSDLWPLYSTDKERLIEIRNRMVHGDLDLTLSTGSLWIATEHLQWMLERILLKLVKWPIEKSRVERSFLQTNMTAMHGLDEARKDILDVLTRQ